MHLPNHALAAPPQKADQPPQRTLIGTASSKPAASACAQRCCHVPLAWSQCLGSASAPTPALQQPHTLLPRTALFKAPGLPQQPSAPNAVRPSQRRRLRGGLKRTAARELAARPAAELRVRLQRRQLGGNLRVQLRALRGRDDAAALGRGQHVVHAARHGRARAALHAAQHQRLRRPGGRRVSAMGLTRYRERSRWAGAPARPCRPCKHADAACCRN